MRQPDQTWLWADAANMCHPITKAPYPELAESSFDGIVLIHSLHNGATNWQAWLTNITRLAAPNCKLCIWVTDPSMLKLASLPMATLLLPGGSYIRLLGAAPKDNAPKDSICIRTSLAWTASRVRPMIETLVPLYTILEDLKCFGWELEHADTFHDASGGWAIWEGAEARIVLRLKH